jgi:hypothetical protein
MRKATRTRKTTPYRSSAARTFGESGYMAVRCVPDRLQYSDGYFHHPLASRPGDCLSVFCGQAPARDSRYILLPLLWPSIATTGLKLPSLPATRFLAEVNRAAYRGFTAAGCEDR